jgi:hypothetical protein
MKGFWTVIWADGKPLAIVKARRYTDAKYRLGCRDLWVSGCQVRRCTPDEYASVVIRRKLVDDRADTRGIWWVDSFDSETLRYKHPER